MGSQLGFAPTTAPTEVEEVATTDDPGRAAHIVFVPDDAHTTAHALVMEARINGTPVTALCGYTWVPSRDAKQFPVCTSCLEIYQQPGDHRDDRDHLPEDA